MRKSGEKLGALLGGFVLNKQTNTPQTLRTTEMDDPPAAKRRTDRVAKKPRTEAPAVALPDTWAKGEAWARMSPEDTVESLRDLFLSSPAEMLWLYFETVKRGVLMKVAVHFRAELHGAELSRDTPIDDLRLLAFHLLLDAVGCEDRSDVAHAHRFVLGLTDNDLSVCGSFDVAVGRAAVVLEALVEPVRRQLGAVQNRAQEAVLHGVEDRSVPTESQFDADRVQRICAALRKHRVWHFLFRLTTPGLECRAPLNLSCTAVTESFERVNAELEAGDSFADADALYWYLYEACRCEAMDKYLKEFKHALCMYAENRKRLMQLYGRQALIEEVHESKKDSDELKLDLYRFTRLLRLCSQLARVNPTAVADIQFSFETLLWMPALAVVRPTASFSIAELRQSERARSGVSGEPATFATALMSLVADALFGWLKRFFEEYGEEPWNVGFEARWGEDRSGFRQSVAGSFLDESGVALWCGIPLRIWVEQVGNRAVVHEFFPLRRDNIEAIIESMSDKVLVRY
jgi:hypothetical protein